jgi:hypothetical protein
MGIAANPVSVHDLAAWVPAAAAVSLVEGTVWHLEQVPDASHRCGRGQWTLVGCGCGLLSLRIGQLLVEMMSCRVCAGRRDMAIDGSFDAGFECVWVCEDDEVELEALWRVRGSATGRGTSP